MEDLPRQSSQTVFMTRKTFVRPVLKKVWKNTPEEERAEQILTP
jgi:hypothetical protein